MTRGAFARWLAGLFGTKPPAARPPAPPSAFPDGFRAVPARAAPEPLPPAERDEVVGWARDWARREIDGGYRKPEDIAEELPHMFEGELDEGELRALAPGLVQEALAAHRREQLTWPEITDCDRLDAAFATLEEAGIVSRQNFSCCGTCGSTEIWDEMAAVRDAGRPVRGYGFFHMQDTESAVEGGGLYLGYGAVEEGEAAALAVAQEIVATIERSGLRTNWDGSWNQRIGVMLDWKRRRAD